MLKRWSRAHSSMFYYKWLDTLSTKDYWIYINNQVSNVWRIPTGLAPHGGCWDPECGICRSWENV